MADQYTWDKAKQAGYKVDVVPLTRQTIADGNLLNSSVVEVFSSRDKYINDNLVKETTSANSVYSTVNSNSAKNWANSALQGFSAIKANDTKMPAKTLNDTLNIIIEGLTTALSDKKLTLSLPDYYKDSYFQRTNRTNTQQMLDLPHPWGNNTVHSAATQGVLFGGGGTVRIANELTAFDTRMLAINIDRCKNSISANSNDAGIQINPMEISENWGININSRYQGYYGAIQINDASGYGINGLAINHSCANARESFQWWNFAMNNCDCDQANNCFAFTNASIGHGAINAVMLFNATANAANVIVTHSANCNSNASTIAMYNSTGGVWSTTLFDSNTDGAASNIVTHRSLANNGGRNITMFRSNAANTNGNITLFDSLVKPRVNNNDNHEYNVVLYNSTAAAGSMMACYHSSAATGMCVAFYNSQAGAGDAFASYNSTAVNGGNNIAMYNSIATNGAAIAMYNSSAFANSYAIYNSTAYCGNIAAFDSTAVGSSPLNTCLYHSKDIVADTEYQKWGASVYSIFMYNSTICSTDISAMKRVGCGGTTERIAYGVNATYTIAKYDSSATDVYNIVEYNSLIGCGAQHSIAMYGSKISASHVDIINDVYSGYTSGVMAFYDSTAVDTTNKVLLWKNRVCIEPSGYVNKIRIIDTVSYASPTIDFPTSEFVYFHPDYNTFIVG